MNLLEFIQGSFLHVAPILVAGIFAVAIIVERSKALYKTYPIQNQDQFYEKIRELVLANKISEAIQVCDRLPQKPTARVLKAALLRAHQAEPMIEHALQLAVAENCASLQKRTSFLATIANVATLLGLFGTIAGLISSFEAVGHADPQQKGALLAAGISQAMNATMMGLGVAIPCMVAFSFLINRTNRMLTDVESSAVQALDILKQRYYGMDEEATTSQETSKAANTPLRRVA